MEFAWDGPKNNYKTKIIIAIITIILLTIVGYYTNNKYIFKNNDDLTSNYTPANLDYIVTDANDDQDGDGIENWKENLLGTDPNSAETQTNSGITVSDEVSSNTNLTIEAAKSIYTIANELRSADNLATDSIKAVTAALSQSIIDANNKPTTRVDDYQIKISPDNSRAALKAYGNSLFGYIIAFYPKVDEAQVLKKYFDTGDKTVLLDLKSNVDMLSEMLKGLYKIPVPSKAYNLHKEIMLSVAEAIDMENGLMKADSDSLTSSMALSKLKSYKDTNVRLLAESKKFFDTNNIVFGAREPGSILNQ